MFKFCAVKSVAELTPKVVMPVTLRFPIITSFKLVGPTVTNPLAVTIPVKYALVPVKNPNVETPVTFKDVTDAVPPDTLVAVPVRFPINVGAFIFPEESTLVTVNIPRVVFPETVKDVNDPIPPITFIAVVAVPEKDLAVTIPVKLPSPTTSNFTFGVVEPIPILLL